MGSERAAALADDFATANDEALQFTGACSDADWKLLVAGEGWTVGVVLHHIAEVHALMLRWLRGMTTGEGVPESAEDVDRANAEHARRAESVGQVETAILLANNGALIEQALRGLSDDVLDRQAPFGPAGGRIMAAHDLAAVPARHVRDHLGRAKTAIGRT